MFVCTCVHKYEYAHGSQKKVQICKAGVIGSFKLANF